MKGVWMVYGNVLLHDELREVKQAVEDNTALLMALSQHLTRVEETLDEVLSKLRPVSEHAEWVDSLRDTLERWRVLPRNGTLITEN